VEIRVKYAGYIARQQDEVARHESAETTRIPADLDYAQVRGLSHEVRQKLARQRPETIGQASRISGITPAAISLLMSRGSDLPFALVFVGVIGGAIAFGFVGVFLGPTLLALAMALWRAWTAPPAAADQAPAAPPAEPTATATGASADQTGV